MYTYVHVCRHLSDTLRRHTCSHGNYHALMYTGDTHALHHTTRCPPPVSDSPQSAPLAPATRTIPVPQHLVAKSQLPVIVFAQSTRKLGYKQIEPVQRAVQETRTRGFVRETCSRLVEWIRGPAPHLPWRRGVADGRHPANISESITRTTHLEMHAE